MRNSVYSLLFLLVCLLSSGSVFAQNGSNVENIMRSNGKIYVVLAVCVTILVGLILYLVSIDRKIAKIEDRQ
jgi:NADH:ubiquinone oxidoreductase subunit 6 (subunit J)